MRCPEIIYSHRLLIRRPRAEDIKAIFSAYAGDPSIGKFLAWPIHETEDDTTQFLEFSDSEWERCGVGPYLIFDRTRAVLIGSTGLALESPTCASTGYVIARECWGNGYATESLAAMTAVAVEMSLDRLYALCHPDHDASQHVLKKCGFQLEGLLDKYCLFPNQTNQDPQDVYCFVWTGDKPIRV